MNPNPLPDVGARVRIERDETRHPSRGTWPRFRGKTGTVVTINEDRKRPHLTEYGVTFGRVRSHKDKRTGKLQWSGTDAVTWFKAYELMPLAASVRGAAALKAAA